MKHSNEPGKYTQHADFVARPRRPGRGRLRKYAPVASSHAGLYRGDLALETVNTAVYERNSGAHRGVVEGIARREVVTAIDHEVVAVDNFFRARRVYPGKIPFDLHPWIERVDGFLCRVDLAPTDPVCGVNHLALKVRSVDDVGVDKAQGAHSRRGEIERHGRAKTAETDDQHPRVEKRPLTCLAHFGETQMSPVPGPLGLAQDPFDRYRKALGFPALEAVFQAQHLGVPELDERARSERRPRPPGAVDNNLFVSLSKKPFSPSFEVPSRKRQCAGDVPRAKLLGLANVDDHRRFSTVQPRRERLGAHRRSERSGTLQELVERSRHAGSHGPTTSCAVSGATHEPGAQCPKTASPLVPSTVCADVSPWAVDAAARLSYPSRAMARLTYRDAGVDTAAGDALIERIKPTVRKTFRPEVIGDVGGFAGLCSLPFGVRDPVLVSGTDGVGTKLKVAFAAGRHDTVGIDLVAMCANDVATTGAECLFFLDYFATGALDLGVAESVISGIAEGCLRAGCALLGGETAEMPGMYGTNEYDLAGFCVGVVSRHALLDGSQVKVGDVAVGVASSGLHSNGYSLARRALFDTAGYKLETELEALGGPLGEVLLEPTLIYAKSLRAAIATGQVHAAAHITGGGLPGNVPRVLPDGLGVRFDLRHWQRQAIFDVIQRAGDIEEEELRHTFNLGLGMVVITEARGADSVLRVFAQHGQRATIVGEVISTSAVDEARVEFIGR